MSTVADIFALSSERKKSKEKGTEKKVAKKMGVFERAEQISLPPEPYGKVSSILLDALKGGAEGLQQFGQMFSGPPLQQEAKPTLTEALDVNLPTQETFTGSTLRRFGRQAPSLMASPGIKPAEMAVRALTGSGLAEVARGQGAPESVQTGLEIAALASPRFSKDAPKLSSKNAEIIEGAERLGLSPEEYTSLLQSERRMKGLGKIAFKRGSVQEKLEQTGEALGNAFNQLSLKEGAKKTIPENIFRSLTTSLEEKLNSMPAKSRNIIMEDYQQFMNSDKQVSDAIKLYRDVNANLKKEGVLKVLKEPIQNMINKVDPNLAKDFNLTNQLYGKYKNLQKTLKPSLAEDIYLSTIPLRASYGVFTGNYPILAETLTEAGAKKLAGEMLVNPRLQNLSKQILTSLNKGKFGIANKLKNNYVKELKGRHPEVSEMLMRADFGKDNQTD